MNKKLYSIILLLISLFCLTSCLETQYSDKLTIVTTIYPQYSFVREIVQDKCNVEVLLKPGQDSHNFDPSVSTVLSINRADMFIYTSEEMEQWAEKIISNLNHEGPIIVNASKGIKLYLVQEEDHNHPNGEEHDPDHNHTYDPHVWTSLKNCVIMVKNITSSLCVIDPDNAEFYKENSLNYIAKLEELDLKFTSLINSAKNKTLYFVSPFSFYYFAKDYGLEYESLYSTCSTEVEPTAHDLIHLIEEIKENKVKYIFNKELMGEDIPRKVASETATEILTLHSGHNISFKDYKAGVTFLQIFERNYETLKKGLN